MTINEILKIKMNTLDENVGLMLKQKIYSFNEAKKILDEYENRQLISQKSMKEIKRLVRTVFQHYEIDFLNKSLIEERFSRYKKEDFVINKKACYPCKDIKLIDKSQLELIVYLLFYTEMPFFQILCSLGYSIDMVDCFIDCISQFQLLDTIERKTILNKIKEKNHIYETNEKKASQLLLRKILLFNFDKTNNFFTKIHYYSLTNISLDKLYFNYINDLSTTFNKIEQNIIESFFHEPLNLEQKIPVKRKKHSIN